MCVHPTSLPALLLPTGLLPSACLCRCNPADLEHSICTVLGGPLNYSTLIAAHDAASGAWPKQALAAALARDLPRMDCSRFVRKA